MRIEEEALPFFKNGIMKAEEARQIVYDRLAPLNERMGIIYDKITEQSKRQYFQIYIDELRRDEVDELRRKGYDVRRVEDNGWRGYQIDWQ